MGIRTEPLGRLSSPGSRVAHRNLGRIEPGSNVPGRAASGSAPGCTHCSADQCRGTEEEEGVGSAPRRAECFVP